MVLSQLTDRPTPLPSQGCDASVLLSGPDDEHSAGADTTLSPDALDLVTRAKAAVDADPRCANRVSCADILALAARDVVSQVLCCAVCFLG
jgi:peroxidase